MTIHPELVAGFVLGWVTGMLVGVCYFVTRKP
jgi:hypothetical protein